MSGVTSKTRPRTRLTQSSVLWTAAAFLAIAVGYWQRRTGPSYPHKSAAPWNAAVRLKLPRSHLTTSPARVAIPVPGSGTATLLWRRYPTAEPFADLPMVSDGGDLAAYIPVQPAAGKVEYFIQVEGVGPAPVPAPRGGTVVLRYRGHVPLFVIVPHIALMGLGLLLGLRVALGAAVNEPVRRPLVLATLALFTVGGLVLGSITQKHAFGAYWTGVPFGWDLTDNKTLVMWLGWLGAVAAPRRIPLRWLVIIAAALMLAAFLVPHSTLGSQFDYTQTSLQLLP